MATWVNIRRALPRRGPHPNTSRAVRSSPARSRGRSRLRRARHAPPGVHDGDEGAAVGGCEVDVDERGCVVPAGFAPRVGQVFAGDPIRDPADLEGVVPGLIVDLAERASHAGLEFEPETPRGVVPVVGSAPPPGADLLGEHPEGRAFVGGDEDGCRRDDVRVAGGLFFAHRSFPSCALPASACRVTSAAKASS